MAAYLKRLSPGAQLAFLVLLFVAAFFVFSIATTAFLAVTTHMDLSALQNSMEDHPNLAGYMKLAQFGYTIIVFLLPPVVLSLLVETRPMAALGLTGRINGRQLAWAVVALVVIIPLVGWTAEWNETWNVPAAFREMDKQAAALTKLFLAGHSIWDLLVNIVLIAVVPAIGEELFFRAGVQRLLAKVMGRQWLAVLVTSIVFSLVHGEILGFVPRVVLGGLLGAIFAITGRLWLSIIIHMVNNGVQVVAFYLFAHGAIKTDPSQNDHVAWYAALLSLGLTVIAFSLLQRATPPKPVAEAAAEEIDSIG